jgi:lipoyl(octanoyl) transferase
LPAPNAVADDRRRNRVVSGAAAATRVIAWAWLGRVPYPEALELQTRLRDDLLAGRAPETLLLLEHEPVITLGRHARPANVLTPKRDLAAAGIDVIHTTRGGDVTFHGPGQLVGYPVFRLRGGLKAHLAAIAEGVIAVLADLGITAEWRGSQPGIWVGDEKICAVGVHVHRRIAIHGFALNVGVDLASFDHVVPCGLANAKVTSIATLRGTSPTLAELATRVAAAFALSFGVRMEEGPDLSSRLQIAT